MDYPVELFGRLPPFRLPPAMWAAGASATGWLANLIVVDY